MCLASNIIFTFSKHVLTLLAHTQIFHLYTRLNPAISVVVQWLACWTTAPSISNTGKWNSVRVVLFRYCCFSLEQRWQTRERYPARLYFKWSRLEAVWNCRSATPVRESEYAHNTGEDLPRSRTLYSETQSTILYSHYLPYVMEMPLTLCTLHGHHRRMCAHYTCAPAFILHSCTLIMDWL